MAGGPNTPSGREKRAGPQGPALLPPGAGPVRKAGTIPETGFPKRGSLPANPALSLLPAPGNLIGKRRPKGLTDIQPPEGVAPGKTTAIVRENPFRATGSPLPGDPPEDPSLPETPPARRRPGEPADRPRPNGIAPGKTTAIVRENPFRATGSPLPGDPPGDPSLPETPPARRRPGEPRDSPRPDEPAPGKTAAIARENPFRATGSPLPEDPPGNPFLPETPPARRRPGEPRDRPRPDEPAPGKTAAIARENPFRATGSPLPGNPPKGPSLPGTQSGGGLRLAGKSPVQPKGRRNGRKNAPPKILPALRKPRRSPDPGALKEDVFRPVPKRPDRRIW